MSEQQPAQVNLEMIARPGGLLARALQEPPPAPPAVKLRDGSYDPFALEEQRQVKREREEISSARDQLAHLLVSSPLGLPRRELARAVTEWLVNQETERDGYWLTQLLTPFKLGSRPLQEGVFWQEETGMMHLLAPEECRPAQARRLRADIPALTVSACGLQWRGEAPPLARFGEWQARYQARCQSCLARASNRGNTALSISWVESPHREELYQEARALTREWLLERVLLMESLPSIPDFLGRGGKQGWLSLERLHHALYQLALVVSVGRWLQQAGDDALYLAMGGGRWRQLRSALPLDQHRMVDLLTLRDWLLPGGAKFPESPISSPEPPDLVEVVEIVLSQRLGLSLSKWRGIGVKQSEKALFQRLTGSSASLFEEPEDAPLDRLEQIDGWLGIQRASSHPE